MELILFWILSVVILTGFTALTYAIREFEKSMGGYYWKIVALGVVLGFIHISIPLFKVDMTMLLVKEILHLISSSLIVIGALLHIRGIKLGGI